MSKVVFSNNNIYSIFCKMLFVAGQFYRFRHCESSVWQKIKENGRQISTDDLLSSIQKPFERNAKTIVAFPHVSANRVNDKNVKKNYFCLFLKESSFMLREQILRTILKKFWIVFRNLKSFFALLLMDTSLPQNESLIIRIKRETVGSGLFEAFLESAPQLILQCSIILRTGNLSNLFY